jgi:transcriptional antiterminator NusG|uniref:Transcription termination/antitermination protein NusG n=1 Tax=candidate division WOR-3 bacterium TaxID=2052148 RepID=A0A7C4U7R5_UNCW3
MNWYILHVLTGSENKVKKMIEEKLIRNPQFKDMVSDIVIPERKIETKKTEDESKTKKKKLVPGYLLIRMEDNKELFDLISSVPGVMGFFGSRSPRKIPDQEAEELIKLTQTVEIETGVPFVKGQKVRIIDGPFTDFSGVVERIEKEKERLVVMVTIFGRATPVELGFYQVQPL